jgi:hypothetical protein
VISMLEFLIDNIFVSFGGTLFQQVVGIPIGTNCAPLPRSTRPMMSLCIFIAYINTEVILLNLQDEIKTDKIELNKFHASKKNPFY